MSRFEQPPRSRWLVIRDWIVAFCLAIAALAVAVLIAQRFGAAAGMAAYITVAVGAMTLPWLCDRFRL